MRVPADKAVGYFVVHASDRIYAIMRCLVI